MSVARRIGPVSRSSPGRCARFEDRGETDIQDSRALALLLRTGNEGRDRKGSDCNSSLELCTLFTSGYETTDLRRT
ncbi:unnamed protein product [Pleuronectes platessa]|uniref:Uncharacterized protein n=1 Tax=Pleuronectes platessa TaxID=8262 RepID=A0A9N7W2U5_PLEPL|nr:unnamed protein product [Pleuronectes platessa]